MQWRQVLMMSTHMAYGFVSAYVLGIIYATWIAPPTYPILMPATALIALAGIVGGILPDIDQLEFWGPESIRKYFTHKKTLHYPFGYFILSLLLLFFAFYFVSYLLPLVVLSCLSFGAGVHSVMDPFDGWRDDHIEQGIFEHITRKWIPSLHLIPFALMGEWILQAFAAIWFIAISANLSQQILPGWQLGTLVYLGIWAVSVVFDAYYRAPKRQLSEALQIRNLNAAKPTS
jgi:hypothetical protein